MNKAVRAALMVAGRGPVKRPALDRGEGSGSISAVRPLVAHLQPVYENVSRETIGGGSKNKAPNKAGGGALDDGSDIEQRKGLGALGLYSHAADAARSLPQEKGTPEQMGAMLAKAGVKPDEMKWSGYQDKFGGGPNVTRGELADHFEKSRPKVWQQVRGYGSGHGNEAPMFSRLVMPGGENYREVLLTLPRQNKVNLDDIAHEMTEGVPRLEYDELNEEQQDGAREEAARQSDALGQGRDFFEGHHKVPNTVAHLRMHDRKGTNGEKILHVEEIQSDWGQKGRDKGFHDPALVQAYDDYAKGLKQRYLANVRGELMKNRSANITQTLAQHEHLAPSTMAQVLGETDKHDAVAGPALKSAVGVPQAPYVGKTDAWTDLAVKRALMEAARGGYDKIAWTPGKEQAERYKLSTHVKELWHQKNEDGTYYLAVLPHGDALHKFLGDKIPEGKLDRHVGKDLARKIAAGEGSSKNPDDSSYAYAGEDGKIISGLDLDVGGHGMESYYDQIVPASFKRVLKPHAGDVEIGKHEIEVPVKQEGLESAFLAPQRAGSNVAPFEKKQLHSIDLAPRTRASIMKRGFKAYASGGEVPGIGDNNPPEEEKLPVADSVSFEGLHPHLISQRLPTAVKQTEDTNRALLVNLASAKKHRKSFEHNVDLVKGYNQLTPDQAKGTPDEVAENFIEHAKGNYLHIHDSMEPSFRERSKEWYVGANRFAKGLNERHGTHESVAPAVIAAMSPQKDWFQNASLAERVMDIHHNHEDTPYTKDMEMTANRIFGEGKFDPVLNEIRGKSYGGIKDPRMKAAWLRLFDQTYHDPKYRSLSPTGEIGDYVENADGKPATAAWGSLGEIKKGISAILGGGGRALVSKLMGERHKVRNFYNNILDPHSRTEDVTIDTHAVAGAHMMPYGGNAVPVSHNFNNSVPLGSLASKGSASTGIQGTYALYAEAMRRAARERNVEPREMQSMTWEGARALFPDTFKNKENIEKLGNIWQDYQSGRLSIDETRNQILNATGHKEGIIYDPAAKSGLGRVGGSPEGEAHSSYAGELPQADVLGSAAGVERGAGSGAASRFTGLQPEELRRFVRHREIARASQAARKTGTGAQTELPASYLAGGVGGRGDLDLGVQHDAPIKRVFRPTEEAGKHFSAAGISAPPMTELGSGPKSAAVFARAVEESKSSHPTGSSVSLYDPEDYAKMRMFLTPDAMAGFALKGDDIVSVFNNKGSGHNNVSNSMLQLALQQGGRKLDALDTILPHIYSRNGFKVVSRQPWNDEYAPKGWDKKDYAEYNNGEPDVVYMAYDPRVSASRKETLYDERQGRTVKNYDDAVKMQDAYVKTVGKYLEKKKAKAPEKSEGGTLEYVLRLAHNLASSAER